MAALSFHGAKTVSSFLAKEISAVSSRRGYAAAAASHGAVASTASVAGATNVMWKQRAGELSGDIAWVPDPKTGCYRPENAGNEVDPVELREMLLKNKTLSGQ